MGDFLRYPYTRPGGRSRSWPGTDFLSTDLPTERSPDWQLTVSPSYKNVANSVTLEATQVNASVLLYGDAATATTLTLTIGSGSFSATAATVAHYGPFVDEIAELSSDRFVEAGTTLGDIAAEDFVIELTCRAPFDGTNTSMVGKVAGGVGWQFYFNSGVPTFSIDDNVTEVTIADAASTVAAGEWCHILVVCDRSSATGLRMYVNGTGATPVDCSSVGSITNAGNLYIGSTSRDFAFGHLAIFKQASWLNGSDYASVATQRFQQIQGWYNADSTATVTPGNLHATADSYDATTGIRRVVRVGGNWIPCRIYNGAAYSWSQISTRYTHDAVPQDLSDAAYGLNDTTISVNLVTSPLGTQDADAIVVNANVSGSAFRSDTTQALLNGYGNTLTFFAKKGASDYIWVALEPGAGFITEHAIINLTNGAVTRTHTNRVWRTENWGNGWYRCIGWGRTSPSPSLYFGPCDSATAYDTVSGDGSTPNIYVWGVNIIRGTLNANESDTDPPLILDAVAGTRTADTLTFNVASADPMGDGAGTILVDYKRNETAMTLADTPFKIEDASATAHNITMTQNTNGTVTFTVADGSGTNGVLTSTTSMLDSTERELQAATNTTSGGALDVAGTEEATNTYTASPADLDKVYVTRGIQNIRIHRVKL